jgi:CDP-paratose 2-epimerase
MRYLITGGCGFIGSNLAAEVLRRGEELFVMDNLFRHGSDMNLQWLRTKGEFKYYPLDTRNANDVEVVIKEVQPDYIFHLAGQVAMTTSISNPRLDFETIAIGTFNLLDSVRKYSPNTVILYSSTNKVYGDFEYLHFDEKTTRYECEEYPLGFPESISLDFHSPYGCSKGTADQYLLDFHRIYGTKTIVFRHAKDVVSLYFAAKDVKEAYGQVFNIGGGIENSLSLLELFKLLENELNIKMNYREIAWRESDQKVFVADISKAKSVIGWEPKVSKEDGIRSMLDWLQE